MKNFLKEFKEFALKGNVMDMAVGVIIGGAFSSIVTALTDNILNPIISCFGGTEIGLVTVLGNTGQVIDWGRIHQRGHQFPDHGHGPVPDPQSHQQDERADQERGSSC